ncbi:hypothetical protein GBP346_A3089 [Burkholderia pseudomallei MSHR346]|nr:hypothetical protein GBP346_A3089 [Burkholderia pseudomallei MSHR346]
MPFAWSKQPSNQLVLFVYEEFEVTRRFRRDRKDTRWNIAVKIRIEGLL